MLLSIAPKDIFWAVPQTSFYAEPIYKNYEQSFHLTIFACWPQAVKMHSCEL